jgi:hypothetical protein
MNNLFWVEEFDNFESYNIDMNSVNMLEDIIGESFSRKILIDLLLTNAKLKDGGIILSQFEKVTIENNENVFEERCKELQSSLYDLERACKFLDLNYIFFLKSFNGEKVDIDKNKRGLHAVFLCTNDKDSNIKEFSSKFQDIFENPSDEDIKREYDNLRREFLGVPNVEDYYGNALINTDLSKEEKKLLRTYYAKEIPCDEDLIEDCVEECKIRDQYIRKYFDRD